MNTLEDSESYLTRTLEREAQRLTRLHNLSEKEAIITLIYQQIKSPKSPLDVEYLANLTNLINSVSEQSLKSKNESQLLKEKYPKSYLFKKVTEMMS